MLNNSIWKKNIKNEVLPRLNKDTECDILIIGGGIAGLSTAYFLSESNKNVVLIESGKCAEGSSSKNTGKLTFMQGLVYQEISKNYSESEAALYLNSQKDAITLVHDIALKNNIQCDLTLQDSIVFSINNNDEDRFQKELLFYKNNGIECEEIVDMPVNFSVSHGIKCHDSYSFNPYKFLLGIKNILKDKISIYEKTRAISVSREKDHYLVKTNHNCIYCNYVVVATHYPFFLIPYFTPLKTIVEKSFIVGGRNKNKINKLQAISADKPIFSFNFCGNDSVLFSRCSHSVTNNIDVRRDRNENENEYVDIFKQHPEYYFQNHDIMTYDYMPFIGKIDDYNMYVLTGFNKWGNTNGIIGGRVISDLILGKENSYVEIFNPKRKLSMLKIKNLILYNTRVISRYVLNKVFSNKNFYDDNVKIAFIDGKKCGIYTDDRGEHIVSNICPHMKCNLVFNYVDKTWDCPCHASRFDIDGNIINGPANYDIKIKK